MPRKTRISKKTATADRNVGAEYKPIRTLRTLSNEEAFHFYENIGKPTGQSAKNLHEFLERIESVKLESLVFHMERDDFKYWIAKILEDLTLAQRIQMLPIENNEQLRTNIRETIRTRLAELEGTPIQTISV
jgi:hypothetical protein